MTCTLLVFVDDATSRLRHLSFVASESSFAYFQAARTYLEDHGKPIALYSDKHSVFRTNKPEQAEGGRAHVQPIRHGSVMSPSIAVCGRPFLPDPVLVRTFIGRRKIRLL